MRTALFNAALAIVLILSGGVFFVSYGYGLKSVAHDFGIPALVIAALAHAVVWIGIAALIDKRTPPGRK